MKNVETKLMLTTKLKNRRGSVLVETAICLTFLLTMLFGIIQYSIILASLNTLQQVSREGARFYCVHFSDNTSSNNLVDYDETLTYMQSVIQGTFLQSNDISSSSINIAAVNYTETNGTVLNSLADDNPFSVSITYNMGKRTFFGGFVPGVNKGTNNITETTVSLIEH